MHQTNGTGKGLPLRTSDMVSAIEQFKGEHRVPPRELKLHPDDYHELKRQIDPYLKYPVPANITTFSGMKIIIDATAERLPRKIKS